MFGVFGFGQSYFAEGVGVAVPVTPPTGTGGAALFVDRASAIAVRADLVIPAPALTAWVTVSPATVTLEAFLHVPVPVLTLDWAVFPVTSISSYAQKGNRAEEAEAQALLEHYMLTLATWKKGK